MEVFLFKDYIDARSFLLILGVIFMVMFLFLLMIGVEKIWDFFEDRYKQKFGKPEPEVNL